MLDENTNFEHLYVGEAEGVIQLAQQTRDIIEYLERDFPEELEGNPPLSNVVIRLLTQYKNIK